MADFLAYRPLDNEPDHSTNKRISPEITSYDSHDYHQQNGDIPLNDYGEFRKSPITQTRSTGVWSTLAWWWTEIVSTILSVVCLIVIVLLCRIYHHRSISDLSLPSGLTLNGLIALIATLNRAFLIAPLASSLMQELWLYYAEEASKDSCRSNLRELGIFEWAARSAGGNFALLFHFRGRRIFASLAALITLVSFLFSTFAQQLIAYDSLVATHPDSPMAAGIVPRIDSWLYGTNNVTSPVGSWAEGEFFYPALPITASIYSGVLSQEVPPLLTKCPSGNCTFPLTPSLGVCGGCVPSTYKKERCFNPCKSNTSATSPWGPCIGNDSGSGYAPDQACDYKLASGKTATIWNLEKYASFISNNTAFTSVTGESRGHYDYYKYDRAYLLNLDLFGVAYGTGAGEMPQPLHATECALWMCVQTYQTSVNSTVQQQTIVATVDEVDTKTLYENPYTTTHFTIPEADDPKNETVYSFDGYAFLPIYLYMERTLGGIVNLNLETDWWSSDLMQGIWNGTTDPQAWIKALAGSMTNAMRSVNDVHQEQYRGTAWELGVRVRWAWLSLPAFVVLASAVLLAFVIVRTARSPVMPWKGGPLTFLLFDIDEKIQRAAAGTFDQRDGAERAVGHVAVRMDVENDGRRKFKAC